MDNSRTTFVEAWAGSEEMEDFLRELREGGPVMEPPQAVAKPGECPECKCTENWQDANCPCQCHEGRVHWL